MTELVLARSRYTGTPVRLNTNREFLARAVRLGFTEIEIVDADSPGRLPRRRPRLLLPAPVEGVGDRAGRRRHPHRVRPQTTPAAIRPDEPPPPERGSTVNERTKPTTVRRPTNRRRHDERPRRPGEPEPAGLAALIQEAEALHEALADARTRAGRLIVALRRYRQRERLDGQHPGVAQAAQAPGRRRVGEPEPRRPIVCRPTPDPAGGDHHAPEAQRRRLEEARPAGILQRRRELQPGGRARPGLLRRPGRLPRAGPRRLRRLPPGGQRRAGPAPGPARTAGRRPPSRRPTVTTGTPRPRTAGDTATAHRLSGPTAPAAARRQARHAEPGQGDLRDRPRPARRPGGPAPRRVRRRPARGPVAGPGQRVHRPAQGRRPA